MGGMFEGTGLTALELDKIPHDYFNNKMGSFYEEDLQKAYAQVQVEVDETVTVESRSRQIGRKLHARKNTVSPSGLNIAPAEDSSITSGLTQE